MTGNNEELRRSPSSNSFGATLEQLRTSAKLSLLDLGQLTHYSRSHVTNIEHGKKTPTIEFARACDEIFRTGELLQNLVPQHTPLDRVAVLNPIQLPVAPSPFVGRDGLLSQLDSLLEPKAANRVAALYGEAGIGKTWLAVSWAHRVRPHYPDGILFVDLHGDTAPNAHMSPSAVLGNWLRALGVPNRQIPAEVQERTALWRSLIGRRRMLVILDDAASAAQVRPLLPGSGFSAVVITSRTRLTDLSVRDTAIRQMQVSPFTPTESVSLLAAVIGTAKVTESITAANQLATFVDHHPLRLRHIAERIVDGPEIALQRLAADLPAGHAQVAEISPAESAAAGWNREPREDDMDRPSVSRVYDVYLGGMSNFAADREFAAGAKEIIPEIAELAKLNRQFLARVVRYCVTQGIRQFIDIGSGIPGPDATHHIAHRLQADCRVVYVDNELVTANCITAAIEAEPAVSGVYADLRDIDAVLQNPNTTRLIDFRQPVGLIMGLLLHFVPDEDNPAGLLAEYRRRIAGGSYLVISHDTGDGRENDMQRLAEYYTRANRPLILRTHSEMAHLVDGFDLVKPGIVHMPLWRPEPDDPPYQHPERTCAYALVARTGTDDEQQL